MRSFQDNLREGLDSKSLDIDMDDISISNTSNSTENDTPRVSTLEQSRTTLLRFSGIVILEFAPWEQDWCIVPSIPVLVQEVILL